MKKAITIIVSLILPSLFFGEVYLSYYLREDIAKRFISLSLTKLGGDWRMEANTKLFSKDAIESDEQASALRSASYLGKFKKCPRSQENKIEILFFDRKTINSSFHCNFENGSAYIDVMIVFTEDGPRYSKFVIYKEL